jgi:hypothetical protein
MKLKKLLRILPTKQYNMLILIDKLKGERLFLSPYERKEIA